MAYLTAGNRPSLMTIHRGVGLSGAGAVSELFPAYPWKEFLDDKEQGFEGDTKLVNDIVNKAMDQIAPVLAACGNFLGLSVEQVCVTLAPGDVKPGRYEREYYAKLVPAASGTGLSGMSGLGATKKMSTKDMLIETAKQTAMKEFEKQAVLSATKAMGTSVPIGGAVIAIVDYTKNFSDIKKDKTQFAISTGAVASAIAACWVPVVGWIYAAAVAAYSGFGYWRAREKQKEAEEQMENAKAFEKSAKSILAIITTEIEALASEMGARGISMEQITAAGNPRDRLLKHYARQLVNYRAKASVSPRGLEWMEDNRKTLEPKYAAAKAKWHAQLDAAVNEKLKKAIVKWDLNQSSLPLAKRQPAVVNGKVRPEILDPIRKEAEKATGAPPSYASALKQLRTETSRLSFKSKLRFLLQAARDMHVLRLVFQLTKSGISAEEVRAIIEKEKSSPAVTAGVTQAMATSLRQMAPQAADAIAEMSPAQAQKFMSAALSSSGSGNVPLSSGGASSTVGSPAAKVVVTVATAGVATGLALLVWKLVTAGKAVS